jgi:hypothetical protein
MRSYVFRSMTILFGLIWALQLNGFYWMWHHPLPSADRQNTRPWLPGTADSVSLSIPETKIDPQSVFDRPVFAPTRRPFVAQLEPQVTQANPQPEPSSTPPLALDPQQFRLMGVLIMGTRHFALIATPEAVGGTWYSSNSAIMGWTITKIEANSIIFSNGRQSVTIRQYGGG